MPEKEREREMIAPLRDVEEPRIPFEVTSMDTTDPYTTTPRENKYLLTFIDHLTKYVEAFSIPDHMAETCAKPKRVSSQIVAHHCSGSTLITDQDREFVLSSKQRAKYCPQCAYFQLSCVLEWDVGKGPPFPPFRLLALYKCK